MATKLYLSKKQKLESLSEQPFLGIFAEDCTQSFLTEKLPKNIYEKENSVIYEVFYGRDLPNTRQKHTMEPQGYLLAQRVDYITVVRKNIRRPTDRLMRRSLILPIKNR